MRTFTKDDQTLVAANDVQARAFISAGYKEVDEKTKVDTPKKGASSKK